MKILYSHYLTMHNHPALRMIDSIANELRSLGHDVVIHGSFTSETPSSVKRPEYAPECNAVNKTHTGLMAAAKGRLWFAKAMSRNTGMMKRDLAAIEKHRPDIVLSRQDAYCWSMPKACQQLHCPLVIYADAPVAHETRLFGNAERWHPPWLVEAIERWGLKQSRAIITVSNPAAERLKQYNLEVPVHTIPNGVHPERFAIPSPAERMEARKMLGLSAEPVVVFQGTFRPFHGIDILRELMLSSSSRTGIQWLLIGDGPQRSMLEEAVAGRMTAVFMGMQPSERVAELLMLADVAVVPHPYLGDDFYFCPLKILESAAAGNAVIAGSQGDIPKLLDHGRAGLLVSGSQNEDWSAALNRVLDDKQFRQTLGNHARRFVLSNFTWEHTASRVAEVLAHIVNHKPLQDNNENQL